MGHYWNELGKVKAANPAQFVQDQDALNRAVEDLTSSRELLRQLEAAELFGGQTDGSIAEVAKGLGAHLQELETAAGKVVSADALAQEAIQAAQGNYDGLPDSTEPNVFEYFAATNPIVQVGSYIMTGQEFLASVTAAREAERERQAKEALDALNGSLMEHQDVLSSIRVEPIEFAFVDANSDGMSGPVSPGDPIAPVPPRGSTPPSEGMPPGAPVPPGGMSPGGPVGSGPGPVGSVPPGGLPDADGDGVPDGVPVPDLAPGIPPAEEWPFRVYRPGDVSRDGPVDGGYSVPLNPRDGVLPRDPVWREMFEEHQRQAQARAGSGLGGLATAAGVAGLAAAGGRAGLGTAAGAGARGVNLPGGAGVAGAGGLGPGARGVGVGGSAAGGLGSGAGGRGVGVGSGAGLPGGGGTGARGVGVGAGGVTPDGAGRAAGAGAGGAAGLRGAGAGGVGSGLGSGAAGAGSAAGAGGARGMGGVPMGGAAGGAGGSQEKDKGRRRRKYGKSGVEFFSLSDPVDPGAAAGEGDAAGARLIDAPQREEGDRW